jgi:hypothetical protein
VRDHQVPLIHGAEHVAAVSLEQVRHIALHMIRGISVAGQQVAGPCVMPQLAERIAHGAAALASHENLKFLHILFSPPDNDRKLSTQRRSKGSFYFPVRPLVGNFSHGYVGEMCASREFWHKSRSRFTP